MVSRIMPLGDSITLGIRGDADAGKHDQLGGYRDDLYSLLQKGFGEFQEFQYVGNAYDDQYNPKSPAWPNGSELYKGHHAGFPGINSATESFNLLSKIQDNKISALLDDPKPDVILLMIGSNDLYKQSRLFINNQYQEDNANTLAQDRVGRIIEEIKSKSDDSDIFVATVPPPVDDTYRPSDWPGVKGAHAAGEKWNEGIATVVATKGDNVHFVDMRDAFTSNSNLMTGIGPGVDNGLHPNDAGYAVIAKAWYVAMRETWPDKFPGDPPKVVNARQIWTDDFSAYIAGVRGTDPKIGFNGVDIGQGKGDGVDEIVPFSFTYPVPDAKRAESALLTLDLTPKHSLITTDELLFFDNASKRGYDSQFYGREELAKLTVDQRQEVTLNLRSIGNDKQDLRDLLNDGRLDVVYADDAIVHGAQLEIWWA